MGDALRFVSRRAEAMAAASTGQAMLSVAGLRREKLEGLCKKVGPECFVANVLFPKGATCGGSKATMEQLEKAEKEAGALQAKLVTSCGAFHTALMAPAVAQVEEALREMV